MLQYMRHQFFLFRGCSLFSYLQCKYSSTLYDLNWGWKTHKYSNNAFHKHCIWPKIWIIFYITDGLCDPQSARKKTTTITFIILQWWRQRKATNYNIWEVETGWLRAFYLTSEFESSRRLMSNQSIKQLISSIHFTVSALYGNRNFLWQFH